VLTAVVIVAALVARRVIAASGQATRLQRRPPERAKACPPDAAAFRLACKDSTVVNKELPQHGGAGHPGAPERFPKGGHWFSAPKIPN
jgi:hypothetical protein